EKIRNEEISPMMARPRKERAEECQRIVSGLKSIKDPKGKKPAELIFGVQEDTERTPFETGSYEMTLLHHAAECNDLPVIKQWIAERRNLALTYNVRGSAHEASG